jgi:hypothetical protein
VILASDKKAMLVTVNSLYLGVLRSMVAWRVEEERTADVLEGKLGLVLVGDSGEAILLLVLSEGKTEEIEATADEGEVEAEATLLEGGEITSGVPVTEVTAGVETCGIAEVGDEESSFAMALLSSSSVT